MARIRSIKPDFFMSEDIGALTVKTRLLYIALWLQADREGKLKNQPMALAAQCMTFEMEDFSGCLQELIEKEHVISYEVNTKKYLYLPTFTEHQRPHHTEKPSVIPDYNGALTVKPPLEDRESRAGIGKGTGKGKGRVQENKFSEDDINFANEMYKSILVLNPKQKKPNIEKWADSIRLMRERDNKTIHEIKSLWTWAHNNDFWCKNILSPDTLRKQWDKLTIQQGTKKQTNGDSWI